MHDPSLDLSSTLAQKAFQLANSEKEDLEKCSWMVVHQHLHGCFPSEYDIREIDENLYLSVLNIARSL